MIGIYKITAQDGKVYIGKSKDVEKRWATYKGSLTRLKSQPDLYLSFKKYGWFNHTFELVEECSEEELGCKEFYWQHFYEVLGDNGLNMIYGSCYDVDFQESLFELKNSYFRNSVLRNLYKTEDIVNINFNVRKYRQRRGEKFPRKAGSGLSKRKQADGISDETRVKLKDRSNNQLKKIVLDTQTGVFYESLKELCNLYGFSYSTMKTRLQLKGKFVNNTQFIYT